MNATRKLAWNNKQKNQDTDDEYKPIYWPNAVKQAI